MMKLIPRCLIVSALFMFWPQQVVALMGILDTPHNLSLSGPGDVRALNENRVCVFCHTPHNAEPSTPLWNKTLEPSNYILYESTTLKAFPRQPSGPSRLCLSCHDGTVALGKLRSVKDELTFTERYARSVLGVDISDDHPVSINYYEALPGQEELSPTIPPDLSTYASGDIHCSTCHDAHDNSYGMFLRVDNKYSMLCKKCHILTDWNSSSMSMSAASWGGVGTDPWPHTEGATVAENGCENCHDPHNAGGPSRLLNYLEEEQNCYPCHNGNVAVTNIQREFNKSSKHPVELTTIGITGNAHDPTESTTMLSGHVECVDCHDPHTANNVAGQAPYASGRLHNVSGINRFGSEVTPITYEYELCFKCHAESSTVIPKVVRVVHTTNTRLDFDPTNPSYHPVIDIGRNPDVPSIPNAIYEPSLRWDSMIYCTDCHDSDDTPVIGQSGPRGPHGSNFSPILRQRYETADFTLESFENYALCYRCHDRNKLLNDATTRYSLRSGGHAGHLGSAVRAPCSACHDPHGIKDDGISGSHTHLINFDAVIVQPAPGQMLPFYTDLGDRTGSCTLLCHEKIHIPGYAGPDPSYKNSSYP